MLKGTGLRIRGALGAFTILCGLGLMWGGAIRDFDNRGSVRKALREAETIDPTVSDPNNNGRLIVAPGALTAAELLGDEFIKPGQYIALRRHVEMLQWVEKRVPNSPEPDYVLEWKPWQVDFFSFKVPQGHENPLLTIKPATLVAAGVRFSGFDGTKIAEALDPREALQLNQETLADPAREVQENKIVIRRDPSSKVFLLGDIRVWHTVALAGDYTIMTVQKDERTLLGSKTSGDLIIRRGKLNKEEFLRLEGEEANEANFSIMYLGAAILWIGLISVMSRFASSLDLRPKAQLQGMPAVIAVSSGITIVTFIVFWLLALVG